MDANSREKSIYKVTWIGSVVNFLLLVFKFIAGILGHSSALVADAVHSLSDFVTEQQDDKLIAMDKEMANMKHLLQLL